MSTDVTDVMRRDLVGSLRRTHPNMTAADRRRLAAELLDFASSEGRRIRLEVRSEKIRRLRAELATQARRGAYPRRRWAKLRNLEAEHADDLIRTT